MTERRFTELQCRLTIAPFLRLLKKKKNTHLERRLLAYSFVRTARHISFFTQRPRRFEFFFFITLFIKSASLPLRFDFFLAKKKRETLKARKETREPRGTMVPGTTANHAFNFYGIFGLKRQAYAHYVYRTGRIFFLWDFY